MELIDCMLCDSSVVFELSSIRGLLFTDLLIAPTDQEHAASELPVDQVLVGTTDPLHGNDTMPVKKLTTEQQCALWHFHLGPINECLVSDLHKYVDGIPKLP